MIVTITGLPGNGKTLYALQFVKAWAEKENRPVFYHGIKGIQLSPDKDPKDPCYSSVTWQEIEAKPEQINGQEVMVPQWWLAPKLAIVLIDEAQNCGFGVRGRGQVPEWARKLEVHRHLGIDLVFITQQPSLIDAHDRALSERHFHLMRKFGAQRATVHEFKSGVRDNVNKSRTGSIRHEWKFPRKAYAWYTSAEAHTHRLHIPMRVWVFISLPFLIGGVVWFTYVKYLDPHRVKEGSGYLLPSSGASAPAGGAGAKLTAAEYVNAFVPRVPGLAYTAPVYDEVTKPVVAPYPAACVRMGPRCGCYTQQGTRLETPQALCESIAEGGFFVAWAQPPAQPSPPISAEPRVPTLEQRQPSGPGGFSFTPAAAAASSASVLPASRTEDLPLGRGRALPSSLLR